MKILDERVTHTVPFCTLRVGEIFTDSEGDFMMRIEELEVEEYGIYNAVNLESGDAYTFDAKEEVIPLPNAHIIIK